MDYEQHNKKYKKTENVILNEAISQTPPFDLNNKVPNFKTFRWRDMLEKFRKMAEKDHLNQIKLSNCASGGYIPLNLRSTLTVSELTKIAKVLEENGYLVYKQKGIFLINQEKKPCTVLERKNIGQIQWKIKEGEEEKWISVKEYNTYSKEIDIFEEKEEKKISNGQKIFICHRWDEKGSEKGSMLGYLIYYRLKEEGFTCWLDHENLSVVGELQNNIEQIIKDCKFFLLLLTDGTLKRCDEDNDFVRFEIETGLKYEKEMIPIIYDNKDSLDGIYKGKFAAKINQELNKKLTLFIQMSSSWESIIQKLVLELRKNQVTK